MQANSAQTTFSSPLNCGEGRRAKRLSPSVKVSCHYVPEDKPSVISRREGLAAGIALPLGSAVASSLVLPQASLAKAAPETAPFKLPDLPYGLDDLAPRMSKTTLEFHWGKHHAAYLNNLNNQVTGTDLEKLPLQEVMVRSWNNGQPLPTFNNAAQSVNHAFFWESMAPGGGGQPGGKLATAISRDFGSFDAFAKEFRAAGATQFGSGWAWLVVGKDGKLKVAKTPNAENPWVKGETPILTMDVWEHAYYLDVQNRRPDYIANFMDGLVNWDQVAERYKVATA